MPLLTFLLALQTGDVRLDALTSLNAPRMTYAELGAWVGQKTGVPVYVVPAIRERKATVLVEDRPLSEIMDRVAQGLFLEWERTKDGYTLRLGPDVAKDEAQMQAAEAKAWMAGLKQKMDAMAEYSRYSPERVKSELADARSEWERLSKEKSPAADAAAARMGRLSSFDSNAFQRCAGELLAQVPAARREAIFTGTPIYGSDKASAGFLPLSGSAVAKLSSYGTSAKPDSRLLFSVRFEPAKRLLWLVASPSGGSGLAQTMQGSEDATFQQTLSAQALAQRWKSWAVADAKLLATPIERKEPQPEKAGHTPYRAVSELLVDLHARTGLPIVADGFRQAVVARHPPEGATLKAWLDSVNSYYTDSRFRGYQLRVRATGGWLSLRHYRFWQQVGREVPEARIRTLEAAARRSTGASVDDFAAFAGSLTPEQAPWTAGPDIVMEAPNKTLEGNVPFLQFWNSLPSVLRRTAATPAGLQVRSLQAHQQRLYYACFADKQGSIFGTQDEYLRYWLPGGLPLPDGMRLFVNLDAKIQALDNDDKQYWSFTGGGPGETTGVPGVTASLGTPELKGFAYFMVPLRRGMPVQEPRIGN